MRAFSDVAVCFLESPGDINLIRLVFVVTKASLDISARLAALLP